MTREQKDFIWKCFPQEIKLELRLKYRKYNSFCSKRILEGIIGKHNLLSNTNPEEILFCDKSKLQELVKECKKAGQNHIAWHIVGLFGNKCLSDKEISSVKLEQPFIRIKPKFHKGDKVKCIIENYYSGVMEIIEREYNDLRSCYIYCTKEFENTWFPESILEFYTN